MTFERKKRGRETKKCLDKVKFKKNSVQDTVAVKATFKKIHKYSGGGKFRGDQKSFGTQKGGIDKEKSRYKGGIKKVFAPSAHVISIGVLQPALRAHLKQ